MRGKEHRPKSKFRAARITPAYAGKSSHRPMHSTLPRDHPRVCGEKAVAVVSSSFTLGSPPRVRGKRGQRKCANCTSRDHPRVCGEKYLLSRTSMCTKGSPPRVRGKGETACEVVVKFGITPAYAGKRACTTTAIIQPKDHPRVCGEKGRAGGAGSWSWSELRWLLTRFPVKVIDTV